MAKSMIALVMDNSIMSVDGQIPLILEAHLENFRKHITDKVVVMGAHTYESIGERPFQLAKETIVMSRHKNYGRRVTMLHNTLELIEYKKDFIVVGGATLFADMMPLAERVYVTEVSATATGEGRVKLFPSTKHLRLENPNTEFQHEGDNYFRHLIYRR